MTHVNGITERFSSFDDVELSYTVWGDGPEVVLLHGFAADTIANWVRPGVVDALEAAGHKVIALDARGHGLSDKPYDPAAYEDGAMVKDVQRLFDHLELESPDVCGYSMGAMNTLRLAGVEPRVRSIVLGGVGGSMYNPEFGQRRNAIADALVAEDPSTIENPVAKAFRAFADSTGADRHALAAIQRTAPPTGRVTTSVPALVITGDQDVLVGSPDELAATLPNASVVVVSGDHLTAVSDPKFAESIVGFLAR
jgi:pimeloyl-ACP methyl ester carboxylesterase